MMCLLQLLLERVFFFFLSSVGGWKHHWQGELILLPERYYQFYTLPLWCVW